MLAWCIPGLVHYSMTRICNKMLEKIKKLKCMIFGHDYIVKSCIDYEITDLGDIARVSKAVCIRCGKEERIHD